MLAVRDLTFRHSRSPEELFGGLDLDFPRGSLTAITGRSGSGKSTLLFVLGLMLTPSSGHVLIDGRPVSDADDATRSTLRARRIGFVFQDSELDPSRVVLDSVIEPALYAGRRRREVTARAYALLRDLGLAERAEHRPGQISGGQAQRVALCRALVNEPDVILADEPTGNLDRDNAAAVLRHLRKSAAEHGSTVVIATHDPFVLDLVDRRVHL